MFRNCQFLQLQIPIPIIIIIRQYGTMECKHIIFHSGICSIKSKRYIFAVCRNMNHETSLGSGSKIASARNWKSRVRAMAVRSGYGATKYESTLYLEHICRGISRISQPEEIDRAEYLRDCPLASFIQRWRQEAVQHLQICPHSFASLSLLGSAESRSRTRLPVPLNLRHKHLCYASVTFKRIPSPLQS